MTGPVLRRVVAARLFGVCAVPLGVEYRTADPAAITLSLATCSAGGTRIWTVARQVVADGLATRHALDYGHEGAAAVTVMALPRCGHVLMVLRRDPGRWPLTLAAADLGDFLAATYEACSLQREQLLIGKELEMQLGFFQMTHGNGGGNPV